MALTMPTMLTYFYPRPPRGGRRAIRMGYKQYVKISIHALREEGDVPAADGAAGVHVISIHALREEGDSVGAGVLPHPKDFYPRPPRGGRLSLQLQGPTKKDISIHALREEGDCFGLPISSRQENFYPRPPRGGRRAFRGTAKRTESISIHALREEGDPQKVATNDFILYFYPRPPRGGRRPTIYSILGKRKFLSTPSARRATC